MDIKDIYPPDGKMQRIHCPACGTHCDLGYTDFSELLSGVRIQISGLPVLRRDVTPVSHPAITRVLW